MNRSIALLLPILLVGIVSCTDIYQPGPPAKPRKNPINPESHLLILENRDIVIGMLPDIGGHIVLFRTHGGSNVLMSEPRLWMEPGPKVSTEEPVFLPLNGHVFWVGPRKDWWTQQDVNLEMKNKKSTWPPDPFLNLGKYEIVEKTNESVTLKSPQSPISGVQITNEIKIKDNKVFLKTTATNISIRELSWNIISNMRLTGKSSIYVPVNEKGGIPTCSSPLSDTEKGKFLPYQITDGLLNFDIASPADKENSSNSRISMIPSDTYMASFTGDSLLVRRASPITGNKIQAKYSLLEICNLTGTSGPMTELEMHSQYQTLIPGESMSFEENWEIVPCEEFQGNIERINFLKKHLK